LVEIIIVSFFFEIENEEENDGSKLEKDIPGASFSSSVVLF
jgi:hypothetical protein